VPTPEVIVMATAETDGQRDLVPVTWVPRMLGATFLAVIVTSLAGGTLLSSAIGSDGSAALAGASEHTDLLRTAAIIDLVTSCGIVALAGLLYAVLAPQSRIAARIAFGLWIIEAALMVVSRLGALQLASLADAVAHGSGDPMASQVLGQTIYEGVVRNALSIHMLFYCTGGLLWYGLFYRSGYLPRAIPVFGLAAVVLALGGTILQLLGVAVPLVVFLPLLPFELLIGGWLLVRGIETDDAASARLGPRAMEPHGA
jgi:hypothetical protein